MQIKGIELSEELKMLRSGAVRPRESERPDGVAPANKGAGEGQKVSFGEFLSRQFNAANASGIEAEEAMRKSIAGEMNNPHATMIAVQKASVSLTLMMSIKERLERAYQELIRMQIG